MSMTDELERLAKLHQDGVLTREEFDLAKAKLLNQSEDLSSEREQDGRGERQNTLGEAANRYVSLQMVMSAVGIIIFLIFLFGVILPHMSGNSGPNFRGAPTIQFTPNGK